MSRGPDPKIDAISILSVVLASSDPAFTVGEVADALGVTAEGARHQMNRLVDAGYLAKKKPGHRTTIYWPTDAGLRYYVEATSE